MSAHVIVARASRALELQSNQRVVRVFKFYREYRARYQAAVKLAINETDYRIAFAMPSAACVYLSQTGTHRVNRKAVPVSPEQLKRLTLLRSARATLTPVRHRPKRFRARALTPPAVRASPPLPEEPAEEEEEPQSSIPPLPADLGADAASADDED
jgi:hypothetical protein